MADRGTQRWYQWSLRYACGPIHWVPQEMSVCCGARIRGDLAATLLS
jgi:hypothetical protein